MLKRNKRIHGPEAVGNILKEGRRQSTPFFSIIKVPSQSTWTRYAALVPKKIERSATRRNRLRRRIYELIHILEKQNEVPAAPTFDIVILLKPAGIAASFSELGQALHHSLKKSA